MAEENNDANMDEAPVETPAESDPGSSPAKAFEHIEEDGFISTTEFKEVAPEDADAGGDTPKKQEEADSKKEDFSKHPRFQELIAEKNELRKQNESLAERLARIETEMKAPKEPAKDQPAPFKNIMGMKDEDIVEEFSSNPKGFIQNMAQQIFYEITSDLRAESERKSHETQQLTAKQQAEKTVNDFFADKEDGQAMLKDGTLDRFVKENPGHNHISAYHALASKNAEEAFNAKLEEAIKAEREKIYNQMKAAGKAAPVRGETVTKTTITPPKKQAENKADLKRGMLDRLTSHL